MNEESENDYRLKGITDLGGSRFKVDKAELLSVIIARLNEIFAGEFTDADVLNYANTIADKVQENRAVMGTVEK